MARARFCQGAAALGRRQNHPRRSGWYAGPLQGKPTEIGSAFEGLCARKHRLDPADARGNAPVPPRPPEHRSVRSRPIAPSRGPLLARLGGGPELCSTLRTLSSVGCSRVALACLPILPPSCYFGQAAPFREFCTLKGYPALAYKNRLA